MLASVPAVGLHHRTSLAGGQWGDQGPEQAFGRRIRALEQLTEPGLDVRYRTCLPARQQQRRGVGPCGCVAHGFRQGYLDTSRSAFPTPSSSNVAWICPLLQCQSLPMQRLEDVGSQPLRYSCQCPLLVVGQWECRVKGQAEINVTLGGRSLKKL